MKENQIIDVYFDMDGTLAVFRDVEVFEDFFVPGFFSELAAQKNILGAAKWLHENEREYGVKVYILSSIIPGHKTAEAEKNAWLDEYWPELPMERRKYTLVGENKADKIENPKTSILLDDFGPICDGFISSGGVAIKVSRDARDTVREEARFKHAHHIDPDMTSYQITEYVMAVKEYYFELKEKEEQKA